MKQGLEQRGFPVKKDSQVEGEAEVFLVYAQEEVVGTFRETCEWFGIDVRTSDENRFKLEECRRECSEFIELYGVGKGRSFVKKGYVLLAEYGTYCLCCKELDASQGAELEYITWRYDESRNGVHSGNYFTSFLAAKADFVVRSGLQLPQALSSTHIRLLKNTILYRCRNDSALPCEEKAELEELLSRLQQNLSKDVEF